ncbi:MAG TPA: SMI1/KNR4 family protein [Chloroflexia bacterium]|nr:SMI1/KNR4 family protein [Chloroflexia bacterium]
MWDLIQRLDSRLATNRPDYYAKLLPGLSQPELDDFEKKLGLALPESFKEFYRWRNGQAIGYNVSFAHGYSLMSAYSVIQSRNILNELLENGDFERENWWHPDWIPFLDNLSGDNYCLDLAGSFNGVKGQVLSFYHDDVERAIFNASFEKWLETIVTALEKGLFFSGDNTSENNESFDNFWKENNPGYPVIEEAS